MKVTRHITTALILACLFCANATAKSRNTLFKQNPEQPFGDANPVLINDYLIYQTAGEGEGHLWSYNTLTHEHEIIHTGNLSESWPGDDYLYTIGNHAYFVSGEEGSLFYWKTDGTAAGTAPLDSPSLYPFHSQSGEFLASWSLTGTTLVTDGVEVVEHAIDNPPTNNICAFDVDDVVALVSPFGPDATRLLRSRAGVVSSVSSLLPQDTELWSASLVMVENQCFALIGSFGNSIELFRIPNEGPVELLSEQFNVSIFSRILSYKNHLYIITYEENRSSRILKLNAAYDGIEAVYEFPTGFSLTRSFELSNEYLMVQMSTRDTSPTFSQTFVFDEDLALNSNLSGAFQLPTVYPVRGGEIFSDISYSNSVGGAYGFNLREQLAPDSPLLTRVEDQTVTHVITHPDSDDIYMQLRLFNNKQIVKLADKPDINDSTAGIWHDPDTANQGLVINRGQRADGSDYLFVSAYVMAEGEPLWLAGTTNINTPQSVIEIELAQFEGANFFEANVTPLQLSWGMVRLEMTSCDGLSARFNPVAGDSRTINLVRIDNNRFDGLCID